MNSHRFRQMRRAGGHKRAGGFTLIEVLTAGSIGVVIGLISIAALSQGTHIFGSNESEMWAREKGSRAIRVMRDDIAKASVVRIYANRQAIGGAESTYGSCVVLTLPDSGKTVAYYRNAANATATSGAIYYDSDTTSQPNPATDKQLVRSVIDLDFRRNPGGSVRVGFQVGTLGYPRKLYGATEADRVRFTTSALPKNL